jgi:drug/metabolite transporter (DMT)-like permease
MWFFYAALMFLASNVLYLLIRLAQKQGIPLSFYSIFLFFIPSLIYLSLSFATRTTLAVAPNHLALIICAALLWSYLGNLFSQKAILLAPNPGYSLILQKSYVVLTTIAAVFLFQAEFSWQKFIAIISILFFALVLSISTNNKQQANKWWFYFSLLTNLCLAFGSLISKHFLVLGLQPIMYLFYINLLVATLNFFDFIRQKIPFHPNAKQLFLVVLIGAFSMAFNFSMQLSYKTAPNIGYVSAINVSSIMTVTILSALFFKDELSKTKIIAIGGTLISLVFLVI